MTTRVRVDFTLPDEGPTDEDTMLTIVRAIIEQGGERIAYTTTRQVTGG